MGLLLAPLFAAYGQSDNAKDKNAQNTEEEPVYSLTRDVTPPRVTRQVNPEYSPGTRGLRIKGSVLIETVVTSRGTPRATHVLRGLDKDIDAAVVAAVNQWQFAPGKKNGKPVAVRVQIEIEFHSM